VECSIVGSCGILWNLVGVPILWNRQKIPQDSTGMSFQKKKLNRRIFWQFWNPQDFSPPHNPVDREYGRLSSNINPVESCGILWKKILWNPVESCVNPVWVLAIVSYKM